MNAPTRTAEAEEADHVGELIGPPRRAPRRPASALLRATEMALTYCAVAATNEGNAFEAIALGKLARQVRRLASERAAYEALAPLLGEPWAAAAVALMAAEVRPGMRRDDIELVAAGALRMTQPVDCLLPLTQDDRAHYVRLVGKAWLS